MMKKWSWFVKINVFHQFLAHESHNRLPSASFEQFRLPRTPIRVERTLGKQTDIPHSILFPKQVPINLPRTVFLTLVHQMVCTDFCREEPLDLRCLTSASWSPRNNIHHFCWCHLRRRRALLKKSCIGSRLVLYNVTSEHGPSCVFLALWFQLGKQRRHESPSL